MASKTPSKMASRQKRRRVKNGVASKTASRQKRRRVKNGVASKTA
jgi:hypothetical protein